VVGITTYVPPAKWGSWDIEAALVPADYVHAVQRAGGRPLLVPPSSEGVAETLEAVDGLIFSGGSDLDPGLYGQDPHPETFGVHALARDLPVLAICRGSQVLNVARGGDRVQHLPEVVGDEKHKHEPGTFSDHDVLLAEGTRLARLLGSHAPVKSHHHQGLGRVGEGLRVAAYAEDGAIEAVEAVDRRFAFGVLWHPEAGEDMKLFEALVVEAQRYRDERRVENRSSRSS
jgi:anthranilate synthase component 2/putative glutamine amidotransferase